VSVEIDSLPGDCTTDQSLVSVRDCTTDQSLVFVRADLFVQLLQLWDTLVFFPEDLRSVRRHDPFVPWFRLVVAKANIRFSCGRPKQVRKSNDGADDGERRRKNQFW